MTFKRLLLLVVICLIAIGCVLIMNYKYDPLSRYPYDNKENRRLIIDHLNDEEIEYIIEQNIAPKRFIQFIEAEGFNIYRIDDYMKIANAGLGISDADIVYFVQEGTYKIEVIIKILTSFSAKELRTWLVEWDDYNPESVLVKDAGSLNAIVSDSRTLSVYQPKDLVTIDSFLKVKKDSSIQVRRLMEKNLNGMCEAIQAEVDPLLKCGGLLIDSAYVSYQEQIALYDQALELYGQEDVLKYVDAPGHSEHQLGLALDFQVSGFKKSLFSQSKQADWLVENAHRFGFIQSYPNDAKEITGKRDQENHYRYVGIEMAVELFNSKMLLIEAIKP